MTKGRFEFALFLLRMGGDRYVCIRLLWTPILFFINYMLRDINEMILAALYLIAYKVMFFA